MKPLTSLFIPFAGCLLLAACHSQSPAFHLTKTSLFVVDSVRMAMDNGDEKAAHTKLQEGMDLLKKGKDTAKSIELFKQSILIKPTALAYYELAGAFLYQGQYSQGIAALNLAEKMGHSPMANVMFRYSYAYNRLAEADSTNMATDYRANAVNYMELAIQMGYGHPQQYLSNKLFPALANRSGFDQTYNAALNGGASSRDPEKGLWQTFQDRFHEISLPLTINRDWIRSHIPTDDIWDDYEKFIPDMRDNRFSRGDGTNYYYIALIRKDASYTAVLYATEPSEDDDRVSTAAFFLTTYDPDGKIIDRMEVAGRSSWDNPFKVFSIQPNLSFQVQGFQTTYKQDPQEAGYDNSNVSGETRATPDNYRIAENGKFVKTDAPLASR